MKRLEPRRMSWTKQFTKNAAPISTRSLDYAQVSSQRVNNKNKPLSMKGKTRLVLTRKWMMQSAKELRTLNKHKKSHSMVGQSPSRLRSCKRFSLKFSKLLIRLRRVMRKKPKLFCWCRSRTHWMMPFTWSRRRGKKRLGAQMPLELSSRPYLTTLSSWDVQLLSSAPHSKPSCSNKMWIHSTLLALRTSYVYTKKRSNLSDP